ncbi:lipoate--protein ligase family protein [Oceanivirga miroungae]|uniref:Lipoate protein ligase n=1 Tax=Oceanivirga miroungae TaxID=1130046 RepID=A0A6I8M9U3_9FUSO|nr:biotin/lipoate A/B protein ligase family protein [Oceanivirga miroungae]VWL85588.1 lipoate protein ligase [Oceanivirga miroungae]
MIYIENDSNDPYYNLAFEDYIFENYKEDEILLFYINKPVIVCGKYQNIFEEANLIYAIENDVAIIRRTSGGGTVYHDLGNINYSFIKNVSDKTNYEYFLNIIIKALKKLGINSSILQKSGIEIEDYKISGGAQKIAKGRIMHHGTLLYNTNLEDIYIMANGKNMSYISKAPNSNPYKVGNIKDFYENKNISSFEFKDLLLSKIKEEIDISVIKLDDETKEKIQKIADEKYKSWEWTFSKSPNFHFKRDISDNGIKYSIEYDAVGGIINNFKVEPNIAGLDEVLNGHILDYKKIKETLAKKYNKFYKYIF